MIIKKVFFQSSAEKKLVIRIKIISILVIKKLKFAISKEIFDGNETHILWVWRSGEEVVVIVFSIMGMDLTHTSGSIPTLALYHRDKLLWYHAQVVLQLVNFCCCRPCLFCCRLCLFYYLNDLASRLFFSFSLS